MDGRERGRRGGGGAQPARQPGPAAGKLSRGALPLLALAHDTASGAAAALTALDGRAYRSFNMIVTDRTAVWFVRNLGTGRPVARALPPGLHMVTAHDPDDVDSPRVARHLPRFRSAIAPTPPDWSTWEPLLADRAGPRDSALTVPPAAGFGTVCASMLGLPADGMAVWRFAAGVAGFETVAARG